MTAARHDHLADSKSGADVLIVEDDSDLREALAESLRVEGYKVAVAGDGQAAMKQL